MISKLSHSIIYVLDQQEALAFYTEKLGFTVKMDMTLDGFRWLEVAPADQPDHSLVLIEPKPPMFDPETAEQLKAIVAKGAMGTGVFATADCRAAFAELSARGVQFLQEPADRPYAVEATFRDNSGNWYSLNQPKTGSF